MDVLVDYTNPLLEQYRSFTHDAILIYGFIPENTSTGAIKGVFKIDYDMLLIKNTADFCTHLTVHF